MNKKIQISLIVLVTVILLLALTIPGMAKEGDETTCQAPVLTVDKHGDFHNDFHALGDFDAYWDEGILYNDCLGIIPFGEQIGTEMRYANFKEACDFAAGIGGTCDEEGGEFSLDSNYVEAGTSIRDKDAKEWYRATSYLYEVTEAGDFSLHKEYTPE